MKERPILFSAPMVRALLDGRKTQTRRVVKPYPKWAQRFPICNPNAMAAGHQVWWWDGEFDRVGVAQDCPYGVPGDQLWVRETWKPHSLYADMRPRDMPQTEVFYRADDRYAPSNTPWVPGIHMPRWASRILLKITDVRVERLKSISEADALAEGIQRDLDTRAWLGAEGAGVGGATRLYASHAMAYGDLWESINGPGSWDANPWVWVVEFKRVEAG